MLFILKQVTLRSLSSSDVFPMTDEYLEHAREICERFETVVNSGDEVKEWSNYSYEFHKALYAPANMPGAMA